MCSSRGSSDGGSDLGLSFQQDVFVAVHCFRSFTGAEDHAALMQPDPAASIISNLHIATNSILCAGIKYGITDREFAVCGIKGDFPCLTCHGEVDQPIFDHQVES
ncbi:MAG: hypothetical protein D3910_00300, partial [Candidatus Electrothrix sp. ATG2]|nr:hypothetical protein [Candidatus Electrothrix sp. ATG2]